MPAFLLEQTVPVGEAALVVVDIKIAAIFEIPGGQRVKALGNFQPVGADILDRRRADRTGNQAEVFQPRPAVGQRPFNEFVPVLAGAGLDIPGIAVFPEQSLAGNRHVQDQAGEIAGQHQVAAAAEDEAGGMGERRVGELARRFDARVKRGPARQGEGIA